VLDSAVFLSTKESGDIPPRGGLNERRRTKVSPLENCKSIKFYRISKHKRIGAMSPHAGLNGRR
jgi:hypothetical protein